MQSQVLARRQHFQIVRSVVLPVVISVMYVLIRPQGPAQLFLGNDAMFVATEKLTIS